MKIFNPLQTVTSLSRNEPKKIGLSPGSLVHVGEQKVERPIFSFIDYTSEEFQLAKDVPFAECLRLKDKASVSWINLDGVHDPSQVEAFGKAFDLHPLALEDILNTGHPPKLEEYDNCVLIITKLFFFDQQTCQIQAEQISLVLTVSNVLTFQEQPGDIFDELRERLKRKSGRIRQRGADYLAYTMIDSVVDSYFHVLEKIGDRLDQLENELISQPSQELLQQIHQMKSQLIFLRKSIWPMREVAAKMLQNESELFDESTTVFLRDLYDHAVQVLDTVESFRETASGLVDLYMSSVSQRMNEVMRVLTVMASIFIPLTFIAGIYGMNFELMPELKWRYGYPMVWGLMVLCAMGLLWFFKRKKWF
ncbi:magnesium transporter [Malonomonas rubra DSM 5091]|uniref:Magnesium transport protein CorA n=1 Tax=Malonomonas rubra DSM 5091 TaxID=1122189 RepID=A0A1M6GG00_MALRU|nr:magnesium/cobalt transporter CorA [Malonomonas rubra]SHJ08857.1 magnesium transporter [Malonomonas rubra DSM 5091]